MTGGDMTGRDVTDPIVRVARRFAERRTFVSKWEGDAPPDRVA
jgi:hypothetical protein